MLASFQPVTLKYEFSSEQYEACQLHSKYTRFDSHWPAPSRWEYFRAGDNGETPFRPGLYCHWYWKVCACVECITEIWKCIALAYNALLQVHQRYATWIIHLYLNLSCNIECKMQSSCLIINHWRQRNVRNFSMWHVASDSPWPKKEGRYSLQPL